MKKLLSILLAMMMAVTLLSTAALAEEDTYPQPEGGKKFDSNWAIMGSLVEIYYEEEGYRVAIHSLNNDDLTGTIWEYNCHYSEEHDALEAMSAIKRGYRLDPMTLDEIPGEEEYELFLEENMDIHFTVNEEGKLLWSDSVENAGADLEFQNIGRFAGQWKAMEEEDLWTEIRWAGLNEETFFYTVFISRGPVEFSMQGLYNPETGKLECTGTARTWEPDGEGGFNAVEDGETYEAFFSMMDNGSLLFETANGIEMLPQDPASEDSGING
ncbi:MAG: hypothetical protein IJK28_12360 [Clostridia bacterium]|nr:hypothetical protein [Clostridia bacterium]